MRRFVGVGIVVVGVILVIAGLNASDSVSSRFSRLFTGNPTDKTIWLLIGGAVAVLVGGSLLFTGRNEKT